MNKEELLWNYAHEQREIGHKLEKQRITITNFNMLVAGGLISVIGSNGFSDQTLIVSAFVAVLGLFGVFMTYKVYERMSFHFRRSREFLNELDRLIGAGEIVKLKEHSDKENAAEYPLLSKIPFHQAWVFLNIMILLFGIASILLSLSG